MKFWTNVALIAVLAVVSAFSFGMHLRVQETEAEFIDIQREAVQEYRTRGGGEIGPANTKEILMIPEFGNDYEMPVVDSVDQDVLDSGVVGHFPESAGVGEEGNYVLTAHRITHGEPFRNLPELDPGDEVIIEKNGATYTYEITKEPFTVHETDVWVLDPHGQQSTITLITCASLAPTEERTVVVGKLVKE